MDIAVPRETLIEEQRVALVPSGVDWLVRQGHRVYVESGAGDGAGFADSQYEAVGAQIVFGHEEVFKRAALIVKVGPLSPAECDELVPGQILLSFLGLGLQHRECMEKLRAAEVSALALELIEDDRGARPVIQAMGEITAGRIPIIAGRYMNSLTGGRGIVLGDVAGVPPAAVVILGAGTVGSGAARKLGALGARVTLLDTDLQRLRAYLASDEHRPTTLLATPYNIDAALAGADIVVGAVSSPGDRAPRVLTRAHVRALPPRSLFIDVAIDQGGCSETSRPTRHSSPTYVEEGVVHYCVPNIPSSVARSSSYALTNAVLPYVTALAAAAKPGAALDEPALARSLYLHQGFCTHETIASLFGMSYRARG